MQPNYAIEASLAAMQARGLLKAGGIRRVAVIGAGLDFADKNSGFDFYPSQTVQPFAVLDSLRRLGLGAASGNVEIVALDISPRVTEHIGRARADAARGAAYTLRLPLDRSREWLAPFRGYWKTFGDRVGVPVAAASTERIAARADVRAVRIAAADVQRVAAADLNIVTQRLAGEPFDLVIATNVFVYYDVFEQALALSNVEAMLALGGFLLSNTALPELRALTLRRVGSLATRYTQDDVGDEIGWYRRTPGSER